MVARLTAMLALIGAALSLPGCGGGGGGGGSPPAPPPPPPPPATIFNNATAAAGVDFSYGMTAPGLPFGPLISINDSTFGGVASGDCDKDGDIDLFITYSDIRPNRLYVNQRETGNAVFVDRALQAGVNWTIVPGQNGRHSGPVFADLDGDGHLDLFLGALHSDPVRIYRNNGNCTFTNVTAGSGVENLRAYTTFSAGFGDYNLDGDLDMFLSHWATPDSNYADRSNFSEQLWENVSTPGNIRFQNVSTASGVAAITFETRSWYEPGSTPTARCHRFVVAEAQQHDFTFTGTFAHLNGDAWPDLLIVGDFTTSQILINNGNNTFSDASSVAMCKAQNPMGSALADYDHDGDLDWFTTSIRINYASGAVVPGSIGNRFFRNTSDGSVNFGVDDITDSLGVASGGWGWAACFLDIDNDADLDIFHTNGFTVTATDGPTVVADFRIDPSRAFIFNGTNYDERGATYGLNDTLSGRGVVCADFDNDGDLDILQTTNNQPNSGLYRRNDLGAGNRNYLAVNLTGLAPNTQAVGARIFVTTADGKTQMREVMVGSDNYTSQNPAVQHFGLGAASQADIRIVWPRRQGGTVQTADTVLTAFAPVNRTLSCSEATTTPATC